MPRRELDMVRAPFVLSGCAHSQPDISGMTLLAGGDHASSTDVPDSSLDSLAEEVIRRFQRAGERLGFR